MESRDNALSFKEKLSRLENAFSNSGIDGHLEKIILSKLQKMVAGIQSETVPAKRPYLRRILDALSETMNTEDVTEEAFEDNLLTMNFNFRGYFFNYLVRLKFRIDQEETIAGKLERLALEYKRVNQVQCEKGLQYTAKYPSLKEIISSWISEEVSYLERKNWLASSSLRPEATPGKEFKVALDLSVAQFTCLVKAFKDCKLILNSNVNELARFFSKIVETKRSENISERSFQRKYYNIEESTRKSVIEMLSKVDDWLRNTG